MKHILFEENDSYKVALLIKTTAFNKGALQSNYVYPLAQKGIEPKDIIGFDLRYNAAGKAPAGLRKDYLKVLLKSLDSLGVCTLYVCDSEYFKTLTGEKKADANFGAVLPCVIQGFEHMQVILGVNHRMLFHNPNVQPKLELSLDTLAQHTAGTYAAIGSDVIHNEYYPNSFEDIRLWLEKLHQYPELTCDIEAFSLRHYKAGIGTIAFAWDEHNGIAFSCDYQEVKEHTYYEYCPKDKKTKSYVGYGRFCENRTIRRYLRDFFESYKGKLIWHNAGYDIKVIIYSLWMGDLIDTYGLYSGMGYMCKNFDDTKLISYLATNSCAGNKLSLKDQAQEYLGNYAQEEINDIRRIELPALLRYNLQDCLGTWFVKKKNEPIMDRDLQRPVYDDVFIPCLRTIIQMELTGMPMCMDKVKEGKQKLTEIQLRNLTAIIKHPLVKQTLTLIQTRWVDKDFETRKGKAKNPDKIKPKVLSELLIKPTASFPQKFNPNSGSQLAVLLHDVIGLPIIEKTDSGEPATDDKTLKALKNHTDASGVQELIQHIRELGKVQKILSAFIPAFEQAELAPDGIYYLFGSFNLGGTVSGRLSSSKPNLTNLPSGSEYGKLVKSMFMGNSDWLFCGADYASLEDRINTLLTQDSNKLKVYTDGFDGHSLRAAYYFREQLLDIDITSPDSVNSISKSHPELRQKSKAPTFALTYAGTWATLVKNCGFSKEEALSIEANYHKMYETSTKWVEAKIEDASKKGYTTLAYGLRLRTPTLAQVVWGTSSVPSAAAAEARTMGNAVSGQSYGLINTMAAVALMERVKNSKFKHDVRLCAMIHDACYLLVRNNYETIKWANDNLIECMVQEGLKLPELYHPEVKLGAELDLFCPSWKDGLTIPNNASYEVLKDLAVGHMEKVNNV